MPHHPTVTITGTVTHLFGHRFVMECEPNPVLADLTPHGVGLLELAIGDRVTIEGEKKPSEIKVARITRGKKTVDIDTHAPHHEAADPAVAERAAVAAGYAVLAAPRRKPKHFEVPAQRGTDRVELHITLDGQIRKVKPEHATL